jgi:acetyl esterase/lipase
MLLKKILLSKLFMLCLFSVVAAQDSVLKIWSDSVPNSVYHADVRQNIDSANGWIKMINVTNPTLDIYWPQQNNKTGTAVIICPGGGYSGLAITHEGEQVAKWLNKLGITAFVLKYRLPDDSLMKDKSVAPLQDIQQAMRVVRRNAEKWNINPSKIGVLGFSAGGHVASSLAVHYNDKVYKTNDSTSARPDFTILIYPVITMDSATTNQWSRMKLLGNSPSEKSVRYFSNELHVNSQTPPAFIIHSMDDNAVPVINSINYAKALRQNNVPCELHLYQSGGHGYGMGRSANTESTWTQACEKWLKMTVNNE